MADPSARNSSAEPSAVPLPLPSTEKSAGASASIRIPPRAIVDQVYEATQKTMNDPAMQKALVDQGLEPITNSSPEKVRAFIDFMAAQFQ